MKKLFSVLVLGLLIGCSGGSDSGSERTRHGDIGKANCGDDVIIVAIVLAEKGYHSKMACGPAHDPQYESHIQAMGLTRFDETGLPEPCNPEGNDGCQWEYFCIDNDNVVFVCDQDWWFDHEEDRDSFVFASGNVRKINTQNSRKHIK